MTGAEERVDLRARLDPAVEPPGCRCVDGPVSLVLKMRRTERRNVGAGYNKPGSTEQARSAALRSRIRPCLWPSSARRGSVAVLQRPDRDLGPVGARHLAEDRLHVDLDRRLGDSACARDGLVQMALDQAADDLLFAFGKRRHRCGIIRIGRGNDRTIGYHEAAVEPPGPGCRRNRPFRTGFLPSRAPC